MLQLRRALAVIDVRDVAADLVLVVTDDGADAIALARKFGDDLDRVAGLVLFQKEEGR